MKVILASLLLFSFASSASAQKPNWQNLDLQKDSVFGISTEKAYSALLKGKKSTEVIVAVIDMGTDTTHEDLQAVLWKNAREIPGNGMDDDNNGYVDDVFGWNFLNNYPCQSDATQVAMKDKAFYDSLSYFTIPDSERQKYQMNRKALRENQTEKANVSSRLNELMMTESILKDLMQKIGKTDPVSADFEHYQASSESEKMLCQMVVRSFSRYPGFKEYFQANVSEPKAQLLYQLEHALNIAEHNNADCIPDKGDNDVTGPFLLLSESSAYHGTSVSSILAADRNNNKGITGVADHVKIMPLRVVSFFQQMQEMQLARAIRYAADNGAKVINISLANSLSLNRSVIDEAVKYAMAKDVLIIRAAGNDHEDLDQAPNYPNKLYADGSGAAAAWLTVGASSWRDDDVLIAPFSDYGRTEVDVFAPGDKLISAFPGSEYGNASGTSVAAPVVSGLAALIREYYPRLTAIQVKDIIMKSVVKRDVLKNKCISGGVINAYNALLLAEQLTNYKKEKTSLERGR